MKVLSELPPASPFRSNWGHKLQILGCNCSLMEGCVPDAFKSAVVTPLIKKPNLPSNHLKNYRPVSGHSFISKLVERVVAKQLLEHIHIHNLDNLYQSAYKAGHSIETALLYTKK